MKSPPVADLIHFGGGGAVLSFSESNQPKEWGNTRDLYTCLWEFSHVCYNCIKSVGLRKGTHRARVGFAAIIFLSSVISKHPSNHCCVQSLKKARIKHKGNKFQSSRATGYRGTKTCKPQRAQRQMLWPKCREDAVRVHQVREFWVGKSWAGFKTLTCVSTPAVG